TQQTRNVFGIGESLGAAVVLQSLGVENRFSAVVAECPYANFERVAVDRVTQRIPVRADLGRVIARPMGWSGFLYARWRDGLGFRWLSPEDVIARTRTPVLLIHGLADEKTSPEHSRRLAARNPGSVKMWLVPGAGHTGAFGAAPDEFRSRVLGWFADHAASG